MTPEQRSHEQRQRDREEFRRGQRLDLIPVVAVLAGMLVLLIGGGMLLVAYVEGRL